MKKISGLAFAAILVFAVSCKNNSEAPSTSASEAQEVNEETVKISDDDNKFVTNAAESGIKEVELSKLAVEHAKTDDVRSFAQKMVEEHTKANEELKMIAANKKLTIPDSPSKETTDAMNDLAKKTEMDFDTKYMDMMVSDHKDAVDLFEKAAKDCQDADIKNFAANTLPTIQMHKTMSQNTRDMVKNMKK